MGSQGTGSAGPGRALGIDIGGTSIKVAVMEGESEVWVGRSGEYARPGRGELVEKMGALLSGAPCGVVGAVGGVGVCAPGLRDETGVIVRAVNVPGLEGVRVGEMVAGVMEEVGVKWEVGSGKAEVGRIGEFTDAHAAAVDWWRGASGSGRVLALSLGTGVGACVLDEAERADGLPRAVVVTGRGPGQIGQMDVAVEEWEEDNQGTWAGKPMPLGPDGGRGTLEAYMGLPALRARYGEGLSGAVAGMRVDRAPLSALVRALRICHAIYLPQRVVLLGGVGMRLGVHAKEMRAAAADGLTSLARGGWTLEVGRTEFHAARGVAWLAAKSG